MVVVSLYQNIMGTLMRNDAEYNAGSILNFVWAHRLLLCLPPLVCVCPVTNAQRRTNLPMTNDWRSRPTLQTPPTGHTLHAPTSNKDEKKSQPFQCFFSKENQWSLPSTNKLDTWKQSTSSSYQCHALSNTVCLHCTCNLRGLSEY